MSIMEDSRPARKTRRSFTDEFKADAVRMVIEDGRSIKSVAEGLDVGESTSESWVRQTRVGAGEREGLTTDERQELARLRKENTELRMERDLLKRATAFWVKEIGVVPFGYL